MASIRDHNNYIKEEEDRNILHLAGELVPSSDVPGAALQMQREMQWFKVIDIVGYLLDIASIYIISSIVSIYVKIISILYLQPELLVM